MVVASIGLVLSSQLGQLQQLFSYVAESVSLGGSGTRWTDVQLQVVDDVRGFGRPSRLAGVARIHMLLQPAPMYPRSTSSIQYSSPNFADGLSMSMNDLASF